MTNAMVILTVFLYGFVILAMVVTGVIMIIDVWKSPKIYSNSFYKRRKRK